MPQDKKSEKQPAALPWHKNAGKEIGALYWAAQQDDDFPQDTEVVAIIASHDPHAETLRLLREMVEDKTEGPFFHEDEHGPDSVLNRARAHLAAHAEKGSK